MSPPNNSRKLQVAGAVVCVLVGVGFVHLTTDTVFMLYPVFAVNFLLLSLSIIIFFWRRFFADSSLSHQVMYALRRAITTLIKLHTEVTQSEPDDRSAAQRSRTVREVIFFLLAQRCLASQYHFVWLHSLLAYKSAAGLIKDHIASMQENNDSSIADSQRVTTGTSDNQSGVSMEDTRSQEEILHDHTQLAAYMLKAFIILLVAHYQISRLKLVYSLLTLLYFVLVEGVVESYLTQCLENQQFDIIEGLEQYYVRLLHGAVEMAATFYLMLWLLVWNHQLLMLLALYTNVYSQGRHLVQHTVAAIFAEWSVVAHFEKASEEELLSLDDICAVCLAVMRKARKTPCRHYFHGHCLRRCLKMKTACPICNFQFNFFLN